CAKETPPYRTPEEKEATIVAIKHYKYDTGRESCEVVMLYDEPDYSGEKVASLFNVGSFTSITREGSKKKLSVDDLKVGQRIRASITPLVISIGTDPTDYGLSKDINISDHGSCHKVVILSDGEE
ncbi:MAG: hypothetical protein IJC94_06935, partial [Oscillospiraceae bacterium]|nr:hypothetical protein [Oscillospiraceae bacterium]